MVSHEFNWFYYNAYFSKYKYFIIDIIKNKKITSSILEFRLYPVSLDVYFQVPLVSDNFDMFVLFLFHFYLRYFLSGSCEGLQQN